MMIDYKSIGMRIKKLRLEKKMTQAQLAEIIGVGTTHISHIETGKTIPSLEALVGIINALECSADELLCNEITKARPILNSWLTKLVEDCSDLEIKLISDMVVSMKDAMRRLQVEHQ